MSNSGKEQTESVSEVTALEERRTASHSWNMGKVTLFFAIVAVVFALDVATKALVQSSFHLYQQVDLLGSYVRLTYIYNAGAAFGIQLGAYSRPVFLVLSLLALVALGAMYWITPVTDRMRLISIALICGGALGNLADRVRSVRGVVDFLDIGVGSVRWPVFNVADTAVTIGAVLLAVSLWREEKHHDGAA